MGNNLSACLTSKNEDAYILDTHGNYQQASGRCKDSNSKNYDIHDEDVSKENGTSQDMSSDMDAYSEKDSSCSIDKVETNHVQNQPVRTADSLNNVKLVESINVALPSKKNYNEVDYHPDENHEDIIEKFLHKEGVTFASAAEENEMQMLLAAGFTAHDAFEELKREQIQRERQEDRERSERDCEQHEQDNLRIEEQAIEDEEKTMLREEYEFVEEEIHHEDLYLQEDAAESLEDREEMSAENKLNSFNSSSCISFNSSTFENQITDTEDNVDNQYEESQIANDLENAEIELIAQQEQLHQELEYEREQERQLELHRLLELERCEELQLLEIQRLEREREEREQQEQLEREERERELAEAAALAEAEQEVESDSDENEFDAEEIDSEEICSEEEDEIDEDEEDLDDVVEEVDEEEIDESDDQSNDSN